MFGLVTRDLLRQFRTTRLIPAKHDRVCMLTKVYFSIFFIYFSGHAPCIPLPSHNPPPLGPACGTPSTCSASGTCSSTTAGTAWRSSSTSAPPPRATATSSSSTPTCPGPRAASFTGPNQWLLREWVSCLFCVPATWARPSPPGIRTGGCVFFEKGVFSPFCWIFAVYLPVVWWVSHFFRVVQLRVVFIVSNEFLQMVLHLTFNQQSSNTLLNIIYL